MKRFVAGMVMLFVVVLAIWAAFRLAPETWAVLAGIVFGLIAALPMCAIALVLLLRGHGADRRPAEPAYYPPQQPIVVLNADPNAYGSYTLPPGYGYEHRLPPGVYPAQQRPAPARPAPPRGFVDRTQAPYQGYAPAPSHGWEAAEEPWIEGQAYEIEDQAAWDAQAESYGAWQRPPPPAPRNARILGR